MAVYLHVKGNNSISVNLLFSKSRLTSSDIKWHQVIDNLAHLLKKTLFFPNPILWLLNWLGLQSEFWQDCQNVESSQSRENTATKGFFELNSFTVIVNSGAKKEIAPLGLCAEHRHLYLVIKAVSTLQCNLVVIDGETVTFLSSNSITHSEVPVTVWVLELNNALRW